MNRITKVISTQEDAEIRRLTKILGLGTDDVQEVLQVAPYGDDSNPIKGMVAVMSETNDSGESVVVGYVNKNQISKVGEKRIFSTDSDGNVVMFLHLKNDGTAEFGGNSDFMVRYSNLETAYNSLKQSVSDLTSAFNSHTHATAATGPPVPPTPIPSVIPATPPTGDISGAKIDEIKTL